MNLFQSLLARRARRQRLDSLSHLDDRLLQDIGFDRYSFNELVTGRDLTRLQERRR